MKTKIEIGNFARRKSDGKIVEKVISKDGWVSYEENRQITGCCPTEEVEDVDHKTAQNGQKKGEEHSPRISLMSVDFSLFPFQGGSHGFSSFQAKMMRGSRFRVQGSGLWWRLRREYIWGDARLRIILAPSSGRGRRAKRVHLSTKIGHETKKIRHKN